MEKINKKLVIIKYGTETLVRKDGFGKLNIDFKTIEKHGAIINSSANPILMVSSGAVGMGKTRADFNYIKDGVARKRALAAVGNPRLSINWDKAISGKVVLQGLITHKEFFHADSANSLKNIIFNIYRNPLYAVIQLNDNDFITDEELREFRKGDFGDNDELTALATELCSEIFENVEVVINTGSDGVIKNGKTVAEMSAGDMSDEKIDLLCGEEKTGTGTGGMRNKLKIFRDLSTKTGVVVHIINGKKPEQLEKILNGESVGTQICQK